MPDTISAEINQASSLDVTWLRAADPTDPDDTEGAILELCCTKMCLAMPDSDDER
jgi:hypothetical protein